MSKLPCLLKKNTSYKKNYIYLSLLLLEDNPTENNQTPVERLVEEASQSSPTPVFNKKRKAKKLVFPGPTVQDSERDALHTPSNHVELDSELELIPQKGKKDRDADMPMIFEPEL
ncbi:hypothetical protein O181_130292 [Austropuccinia psidii MF-1]|uniref:Uncharacterized protein n=1 Tax=Austropuccinia psidii MF-1 TaxID=1389203 RepID=A0A9Q3L0X1_9BASI|nr:hypothetical protein [Austropuccinia psidii MF-1]